MNRMWYMVLGICSGLLFAMVAPIALNLPFEFEVFFYAVCGLLAGLVVDIAMTLGRGRWSIADLIKLTFLIGVLLAIGKFLAVG